MIVLRVLDPDRNPHLFQNFMDGLIPSQTSGKNCMQIRAIPEPDRNPDHRQNIIDCFWYENVTGIIDIFGQMASTSIKHVQLADGCNSKYTLRHALGKGFIWVLPQGHVKVI